MGSQPEPANSACRWKRKLAIAARCCLVALMAVPLLYLASYGVSLSLVARHLMPADTSYSLYGDIPKDMRLQYSSLWARMDPSVREAFKGGAVGKVAELLLQFMGLGLGCPPRRIKVCHTRNFLDRSSAPWSPPNNGWRPQNRPRRCPPHPHRPSALLPVDSDHAGGTPTAAHIADE